MAFRSLNATSACPINTSGRWIYFIQECNSGPIKIGYAFDVAQMLTKNQVGNPRPLRLIAAFFVKEADTVFGKERPEETIRIERQLHQYLAESRVRGEWFKPTAAVVHAVRDALTRMRA